MCSTGERSAPGALQHESSAGAGERPLVPWAHASEGALPGHEALAAALEDTEAPGVASSALSHDQRDDRLRLVAQLPDCIAGQPENNLLDDLFAHSGVAASVAREALDQREGARPLLTPQQLRALQAAPRDELDLPLHGLQLHAQQLALSTAQADAAVCVGAPLGGQQQCHDDDNDDAGGHAAQQAAAFVLFDDVLAGDGGGSDVSDATSGGRLVEAQADTEAQDEIIGRRSAPVTTSAASNPGNGAEAPIEPCSPASDITPAGSAGAAWSYECIRRRR